MAGSRGAQAHDLGDLSAVEAVGRMSRGELSAERYAEALLARCRAAHALNAFITLDPARVLEDARAREREIRLGAEDYADEILNTLEVNLSKFIAAVRRGRERLAGKEEPVEVS